MKFWGKVASGILPFSEKSCKVLLQQRSENVLEPNTWGIIGGAVSSKKSTHGSYNSNEEFAEIGIDEHNIKKSAIEELKEETNYDGIVHNIVKLHEFPKETPYKDIKGFEYYTYIGLIDEIDPPIRDKKLIYSPQNDPYWEAKGYKWVDVDMLLDSVDHYKKGDHSKFEKLIGKKGSQLHPSFMKTLSLPNVKKRLKKYNNRCRKGL